MHADTGARRAKQCIALGLLGALALLVGGWFLLVSPKRAEAALLREQTVVQTAANERSETNLEVLRVKAAQVPGREAELAEVATRIPDDEAVPDLLRSLSSAAAAAGVELVSVVPGTATAVAASLPAGTAAAPAPVAAPAAPGAAPAPAPAVPGAAAAPAPAVPGATAGLLAVPLTLEVVGGFYDIEQFVAELEELPRALRLTEVALVADAAAGADAAAAAAAVAGAPAPVDRRSLRTTLTGSVFLQREPTADAATGTAPGAAAAAPAAAAPAAAAPAAGQPAETTS